METSVIHGTWENVKLGENTCHIWEIHVKFVFREILSFNDDNSKIHCE